MVSKGLQMLSSIPSFRWEILLYPSAPIVGWLLHWIMRHHGLVVCLGQSSMLHADNDHYSGVGAWGGPLDLGFVGRRNPVCVGGSARVRE